jgi:VWFA-related protein
MQLPVAGNQQAAGASDTLTGEVRLMVSMGRDASADEFFGEDQNAVNVRRSAIALAALAGFGLAFGVRAQQQTPVPDAPTPQAPTSMPGAQGPITPGIGSGETSPTPSSSNAGQPQPEQPTPPSPSQPPATTVPVPNANDTAPEEGNNAVNATIHAYTTEVVVPVLVKDSKGAPVAGLDWRDFTVYENNIREPLRVFSTDPRPMSIAFVIDQSLPSNVMRGVNESLGAIQGALTPYDEAAVFAYGNGPKELTSFTGAQGARLPAVLSLAQATGTDPQVPVDGGPFASCSITENGGCVSPVLQSGGSTGSPGFITLPKEIHTLNDAILLAAKELSARPRERLRAIYVISDGKEYGSKATWKEVVKYLQTNNIAVYATVVGDSAHWGEGWLDRFHVPFTGVYDNILYQYVGRTGGEMFSEGSVNNIEKSYARIADEARNQYTLIYASHIPIYDDRFRNIDVRVDRPNVVITAKLGYYPSAQGYK